MAELVEAEGMIHAINAARGEYTLCGDAFDLGSDVPGYEQRTTRQKVVTCPECVTIIRGVRGVRTKDA